MVVVIAGKDRGRQGTHPARLSGHGSRDRRARQHDQAAHEAEPGQEHRRRHLGEGGGDPHLERDARGPGPRRRGRGSGDAGTARVTPSGCAKKSGAVLA